MRSVIIQLRDGIRARRARRGAPNSAVIADADHPWLKSIPAGVDWAADIPVSPVHCLIEEAAGRFAERPCIEFLGRMQHMLKTGKPLRN